MKLIFVLHIFIYLFPFFLFSEDGIDLKQEYIEEEARQKEERKEEEIYTPPPEISPAESPTEETTEEDRQKEERKEEKIYTSPPEMPPAEASMKEITKKKEKLAKKYEKEKKFQQAADIYEELLLQNPTNYKYKYRLGRLYSFQKKWSLSEKYFLLCLKEVPKDYDARLALSRMYYWKNDYFSAQKEVLIVIDNVPKYTDAYILLGRIYSAQGQQKKARKAFKKALSLDPQNKEVLLPLGQLEFSTQHFKDGKKYFKKAYKVNENKPYAKDQYINIKSYVDPSIKLMISGAQEREKDLISKLKTTQINYFTTKLKFIYPINDHFHPFATFLYAPEKQKNLILKRYNYNVNNYYYTLGLESFFKNNFSAKLMLPTRVSRDHNLNIFPFHNKTRFEPSLLFKYSTQRNLFIFRGYLDSFIARRFVDFFSYLVRRNNLTGIYEHRIPFQPLSFYIGGKLYFAFYENIPKNTKYEGDFWSTIKFPFFIGNFLIRYEYKCKSFDKRVPDYYTYKREETHFAKFSFNKKWLPGKYLELSYTHQWRRVKDMTNEATEVTSTGSLPEILLLHRYEGNIYEAFFSIVIGTSCHLEASAYYYTNTDDYEAWVAKGGIKWVF